MSGGGIASLRPLLAESMLTPEQRDVIEFLEFLEGLDDSGAPAADVDVVEQQQNRDSAELLALRDEVADLREVNDAAAAALGACLVCWGGDESVPCAPARGVLRLYNQLVRPAVERMTAACGALRSASRRDFISHVRKRRGDDGSLQHCSACTTPVELKSLPDASRVNCGNAEIEHGRRSRTPRELQHSALGYITPTEYAARCRHGTSTASICGIN
jgi:hypothetical protein